jgi:prepilin-type N-terminal cleavage/methylation domain-containing protein
MRHEETANRAGGAGRGFTLMELIVVIVILAIAAAVAVPMAVGTGDMQVIGAARMLSADLQYAQSEAVTAQQPVTVSFTPSQETYALTWTNTSAPLIHPMTKGAYTVDFRNRDGFANLDVVSASFGGSQSVEFDELGAPDEAGTVTLQAGEHVYQVSLASVTGKVTVTAVNP